MSTATKTCLRCGHDCSAKPRIKDAQGRYTCKACLKPEELAKIDAVQVARPKGKPPPTPPPPPDDAPHSLADLESAPELEQAVCPGCQSSVPYGGQICVQCGYNLTTGTTLATRDATNDEPELPDQAPGRAKCPQCGYDLKGLKKPRCPECGTVVLKPNYRDKIKEDSSRAARWAYVKPVIQFAVGMLITLVIISGRGQAEQLPGYMFLFGVQLVAGTVAFFFCCLVSLGFDAPMHLTALRLAGVYAIVEAAAGVLSFIPIPIVSWAILLFLYVGMLAESLELDISDAIFVGVVTFGMRIIIGIALVAYIITNR